MYRAGLGAGARALNAKLQKGAEPRVNGTRPDPGRVSTSFNVAPWTRHSPHPIPTPPEFLDLPLIQGQPQP